MKEQNEQGAYPRVELLIDGQWRQASDKATVAVINPATEEEIGRVPTATINDLDEALSSSDRAFKEWSRKPPHYRYLIMKKAAQLLSERAKSIAVIMTMEQGKPLAQAQGETEGAADVVHWFAEEGMRIAHQIVPSRNPGVEQRVYREPIGPVAAFTPWNFPVSQAVKKLCAALATGCTIILKGPEDTPASCAALVAAFVDAGLPAGVINLVYGEPSTISDYLIRSPIIRKISFTGSTTVGKQLASLAGSYMKPATMELGGHGPVLVFSDADINRTVSILAPAKYRNSGQVCTSPTRFIVQHEVKDEFVSVFADYASKIKVGNGLDPETQMGPLAHSRRLTAMETLVPEAIRCGARLVTGGKRIGNRGYFYAPTVLADVPLNARIMNEEPFGPVALINSYDDEEAMIEEANRLQYGLAAYVYTGSTQTATDIGHRLVTGMVSINHQGFGAPEVPFGGVRDSGYGNEGGREALDAYLVSKFLTCLTTVTRSTSVNSGNDHR